MNRINKLRRKHAGARLSFWSEAFFVIVALFLCALIAMAHPIVAIVGLSLLSFSLMAPSARTCAVTLSVPELLMDVLDAFKLETPELFEPGGFSKDFSSKTAVLGDKITAKIAHVPVTATYDPTPGVGFYNGAQDVTTLIEDVPVTLNQFIHVPIKVAWLSQLSSKLPLYKEAVRNYGYALGKQVVDTALGQILPGNFSNSVTTPVANVTLDTFDNDIRNKMNSLKVFNKNRWALLNSSAAGQLGQDDRVRSSLFYGALNGDNGYRKWANLAGFNWVREYPDFPTANNLWGFAADPRAIAVASRRPDFSNVAAQLGVPQVMEFYPITDEESGLYMTGVAWQEVGTGDVYVSAAILFGVSAGSQGGGAGKITDSAGVLLKSA